MKVLIIHNYYQWPGGEDFAVEQDSKLLKTNGHEVFLLTDSNLRINEMSTVDLLTSTFWNKGAFDAVRQMITENGIDLVHIHNYFPLLSPSIFKAADSMSVPVVHSVHNYRLLCINGLLLRDGRVCEDCITCGNFLPGVINKCYRTYSESSVAALSIGAHRLLKTIEQSVDRFIVLSELAVKQLAKGGLPADSMSIKRNFLFSDYGEGEGEGCYATYAGRLAYEKGLDTMIAAWDKLEQKIPLRIAGDGLMTGDVAAFVARNPAATQLGWLEEKELSQLLGASRLLIFPSLCYEQDPLTIIQSLCAGTPIVISDVCAYAEELRKDGVAWVFKAGNADDLATTVEQAFSTPTDELKRMRKRAREVFCSRFSADANYRRLMEIYDEAGQVRRNKTAGRKS